MNTYFPKNYDVVIAFVIFLICIFYALFAGFELDAPSVANMANE